MRCVLLMLILSTTPPARADILHGTDGSRYSGEVVRQDEHMVLFRILLADGKSGIVKRFPRAAVLRIEPSDVAAPVDFAEEGGEEEMPPAGASADFAQMLREAYELLDDGDPASAAAALQKIIVRAPAQVRAALSLRCRRERGATLAELAAAARVRTAAAEDGFHIRFATPYEAAALGTLLQRQIEALWPLEFAGRSLREWSAKPETYAALQPDVRAMVAAGRRLAGMLGARLEYDPALAEDRAARKQAAQDREAVIRLVRHVITMPGYTEPQGAAGWSDDPGAAKALELAAERIAEQSATSQPAPPADASADDAQRDATPSNAFNPEGDHHR